MSSGISVSSSTHRSRSNGEPTYTTTARAITTLTRVSRAAIRLLQSLWLDELSQTLPVPHLVSPPNPRLPPPEMPPLLLLHRDPGVLPNSSPDNRDPRLLRPKQQRGLSRLSNCILTLAERQESARHTGTRSTRLSHHLNARWLADHQ